MSEHVNILEAGGRLLGCFDSSPFNGGMPILYGEEHISADGRRRMQKVWDVAVQPARTINVYELPDVYLTGQGLVFTPNLKVIEETVTQNASEEVAEAKQRIAEARDILHVRENALLMKKRGESNYGHWLVELLPRLPAAMKVRPPEVLITPSLLGAMGNVVRDTLNIGWPLHAPRRGRNVGDVTHFRSLTHVDGLSFHGSFLASSVLSHVTRFRRYATGAGVKRLYVERPNTDRSLINESAVRDLLVGKLGFRAVNPGAMKFSEQVSLFRDAEIIVGIMGAAMTNAVFAPKQCTVIHLAPGGFSDTFFYLLSSIVGQRYVEIRGPSAGVNNGRDTGFSVDIAHLRDALSV